MVGTNTRGSRSPPSCWKGDEDGAGRALLSLSSPNCESVVCSDDEDEVVCVDDQNDEVELPVERVRQSGTATAEVVS
jgi:hypothetical protein